MFETKLKDFLIEFEEIKARSKNNKISILFATKYLNKEQFVSFIRLGNELSISPFIIGENRVQDAQEKLNYLNLASQDQALRKSFKLSLIGNLQKNKINKAIDIFDEIHSVDSIDLAKTLDQRLKPKDKRLNIFLEVNLSGESTKHGFKKKELDKAISTMKQFNNLTIKGLMTMPPPTKNPENNRPYFHKLRLIANRYKLKASMGTSQDWKIAVEEGADIIRIGSGIFR